MTKKKKEIDFPVFSIHGNYFQEEIEQAITLRQAMEEISTIINETGNTLNQIGSKLNIFINNVTTRTEPFDFEKNFVIFSDENEISIYPHEIMDEIIDAADAEGHYLEDDEIFDALPESNDKVNLNKKQMAKCIELVNEYNSLYDSYESSIYELEDCNVYYQCIIDETKNSLSKIKLFDLTGTTDEDELEPFNDKKHDLLIVRDKDTKFWKFIYLHKENRDKLIDILKGDD